MSTASTPDITIAGAGLVGSLMAIFLAKKGFAVQVIEKRTDPRSSSKSEGRSINLALSHRGLRALEAAARLLPVQVLSEAVPLYGRQMHDEEGKLSYQAYGKANECIYSVSRARLNACLIDEAERQGAVFLFDHQIEDVDVQGKTLQLIHKQKHKTIDAPVLIAADGAFSRIRTAMEEQGFCSSRIEQIDHGYKELEIPSDKGHLLNNTNALHIWPRGKYMLIALPNFDGSYTGTLFLPFKGGDLSFEELKEENIQQFFEQHFTDTLSLIPDLLTQYRRHPTSSLCNVYTDRWSTDSWLLIGDAAHAIVPFYGQGMNAGFEDCRLLNELLERSTYNWEESFQLFSQTRPKDSDAIARLAMENFIEMRDLVADEQFLLRKKIESALSEAFPEAWTTLYREVTFSSTPYHQALKKGENNARIMDVLMNRTDIDFSRWNEQEIWEKILRVVETN